MPRTAFTAIALRSTLAQNDSTLQSPIYGLNRTKLCIHSRQNCLKLNSFDILTVYFG